MVYIIVIAYIIINLILASFMADAAYAKGYDESAHAFGVTFWLGIFGCLYVIALPDLRVQEQNKQIIELLSSKSTKEIASTEEEEELPEI